MKPYLLAALITFLILAIPLAGAIQPPDVTFIPAQISANSNFLLIVDPHVVQSEKPVTVTWWAPGIESNYSTVGTLTPTLYSKWIWYFSNTDPESNGHNVFELSTADYGVPYTLMINATNTFGQTESTTLNLTVGGIEIRNSVYVTGKNIVISAWAYKGDVNSMRYEVYNDAFDKLKSGTMAYNDDTGKFNTNITLENGEYYIGFKTNTSTDFGGGVARVVVGSTTQTDKVSFDNIVYSPVINPGQKFKIETFKITNTGTENLTALSISVASEISTYLTITPKQTSLEPNESAYLTVALENIQTSMNISTFANLKSGSTQLAQIPVNLMVSVIGSQNLSSCVGKVDKTLCLGGMCCGEVCRVGADCCTSSDCSSDETCSSSFKCVKAVILGECEGKNDSTNCSTGVCCNQECVECCSDLDCTAGKTCSSSNTCVFTTPDECAGKSDKTACTGGICCSESCVKDGKCCVKGDCAAGETCNSNNVCEKETPETSGLDMTTIALVGGGVAAAGIAAYFLLKKFRKKGGEGDEELEPGEEGEEEFSDEDFY